MALTVPEIKSAQPRDKNYRLYDSGGLYVEVSKAGGKWWRFKYRFAGKEKRISLGVFPEVGLKDARQKRDLARAQLANGIDPSVEKKVQRLNQDLNAEDTFESIAREWHARFSSTWSEEHQKRILRRLEKDIFPWLGNQPITTISATHLLGVIRKIEKRNAVDTAHRALQNCSQVFRYAISCGKAERDPSADLRGALTPVKTQHYPSFTDPKDVSVLLKAIDAFEGEFVTHCALRLAPLLLVRPGELRHAEWDELNLPDKEWRIPAEKMKMKEQHIVPLSRQAINILLELQPLTGRHDYLFPGVRSRQRPLSENTLNVALRRLGFTKEEMTTHGFRSMGSTLLNELGWNRDAIERQLAHAERSSSRAAYNFAEYLPERRQMMQAWADYLDKLRAM